MMLDKRIEDAKSGALSKNITSEELLQQLMSIANEYPNEIRPHLELGMYYTDLKEYEQAILHLDRAHVVGPHNFWPFYLRAKICESVGDYRKCLDYLSEGLDLCAGRVSQQEYSNLGKLYADVKGIESYRKVDNIARDYAEANKVGRPISFAARVSLVKDEDDIIYAGLLSSYRAGLRYFVVADNMSSDDTAFEIKRFANDHPDAIVYVVNDPVVAYYQAAKTMGLARLAENVFSALGQEIEWVFPLDADEEIHIPESADDLLSVLEKADRDGAKILAYNFCNTASSEAILDDVRIEMLPGVFNVANHPLVPLVRKVAFRISKDAAIEQGNHYCYFDNISGSQIILGVDFKVYLKHYAFRTVYQLRKKVLNNERALRDFKGPEHFGAHWKRDVESFYAGGDEFLKQKLERYIQEAK